MPWIRHAALALLAALAYGRVAGADALVRVSGATPFTACSVDDPSRQPGTVYPASEVEPRLAVNPRNPKNIVGAFQQDRWSNGGARGIVVAASFDGGASWRQTVVPKLAKCSGGPHARTSDPWVSFAPNGDVYLAALSLAVDDREPRELHEFQPPSTDALPAADNAILVSKSTDGGLSWGDPVALIDEGAGPLNDKESVTADATEPSGRLVYVVWDRLESLTESTTRGPVMFSRTTDGGARWEPARAIYDPGANSSTVGAQLVVLPSGTLLVFFTEFSAVPGPGNSFRYRVYLSVVMSTDKGQTWGSARRAFAIGVPRVDDPDVPRSVRHGGALVDVAGDPRNGILYAVVTARDAQGGTSILLSTSTDAGATWWNGSSGRPFINRTPIAGVNGQAFTPTVQVNARGTVGVTYYDFRANDAGPGTLTDYWLVRCEPVDPADCRLTDNWRREVRLTDSSFDLGEAPYAYGLFVGDYEGLAADGEDFLAFFSQGHGNDRASVFFRRVRP